jgi:preprotein translocase subunit SecE
MNQEIGVMDKIKLWVNKIKVFLTDARIELRKVTWPTRKQTVASTSVVILVVVIVSLFLGVVDFGLAKIIKLVLG